MVWVRSCPYASEHIPSGARLASTRMRYERRTAAHHGQPGGWAAGCAPAMHECSCASRGPREQSLLSSSLCWNTRIIRARRAPVPCAHVRIGPTGNESRRHGCAETCATSVTPDRAARHILRDGGQETLMPSMASSPWIRGAPQSAFSWLRRRIIARVSAVIAGRPGLFPDATTSRSTIPLVCASVGRCRLARWQGQLSIAPTWWITGPGSTDQQAKWP